MRSYSHESSSLTYENISARINRLKINNAHQPTAKNYSTLLKSDSASNLHHQYSRIKQNENVLYPYGR